MSGGARAEEVVGDEFARLLGEAEPPLWCRPEWCDYYGRVVYLVERKGTRIRAAWALPMLETDRGLRAERGCRLLPYAAPLLLTAAPERRDALDHLVRAAMDRAVAISLPLAPGFTDIAPLQDLGVLVQLRHTHVLPLSWRPSAARPSVRNHLRHLRRAGVTIAVRRNSGGFVFERAVLNEVAEGLVRRRCTGEALLEAGAAYYVEAARGREIVGQAFVVALGSDCDVVLHTWTARDAARGIASGLLAAAAETSAGRGRGLDLEGSVIPGVDRFFYQFGGDVRVYGHMRWSREGSVVADEWSQDVFPYHGLDGK